jgi:hypothetical protein
VVSYDHGNQLLTRPSRLSLLLVVSACSRTPASPLAPTGPSTSRVPVAAPSASSPPVASALPDPAHPPCADDDTACVCDAALRRNKESLETDRLACADSLSRAQSAAAADRFADAIQAIDRTSMDRCSRDANVEMLTVLGAAELSIGRAADAVKDFDGALAAEADATRAAELLLRRGNALKGLGQARAAGESFYWSNRLHASRGAESRLGAPGFCPVRVSHGDRASVDRGWLAWWHRRTAGAREGTAFLGTPEPPVITDDASVRAALAPTLRGPSPWIVQWKFPESEFRIVATRGESVLDFGVVGSAQSTMTAMARPYLYGDDIDLSRVGRFTLVHAVHVAREVYFGPVAPHECDPTATPEWVALSSRATETYLVVDVAQGLVVTRLELEARFPAMPEDDVPSAKLLVTVKPGRTGFDVSETACGVIAYEATP